MNIETFRQRRAGVLLHPCSLPSSHGQTGGDIGPQAHRFLQWLAGAGFGVWQMLPTGPTHGDGSPYQSLSVHAGNAELISLEWLRDRQWLTDAECAQPRPAALRCAAPRFAAALGADGDLQQRYTQFCEAQQDWLDDYALFIAAREARDSNGWFSWPLSLRRREAHALAEERRDRRERVDGVKFEQFVFFEQWRELRNEARRLGIELFGDMPIFVAHDSADVWANQELFQLADDGTVLTVAGVPPDYFSELGQRWGNPHYDWAAMEARRFDWWRARVRTQWECFDIVRIDHFRGFEAYWEIPAHCDTAVDGHWVKAPGAALLSSIFQDFPQLRLVAENLGTITAEVEALRAKFQLPGMLILQFAFSGNADNPYLPHNHAVAEVVYTGTHDNDTTLGWFEQLDEATRGQLNEYLGYPQEPMPWPLIRCALASVAQLAVIPWQDLLALGSDTRMNTPGTTEGNWRWQFDWNQVPAELDARMRAWLKSYGRLASQ